MSGELRPDPVQTGFNTAGEAIMAGKAIQAIQTPYATAVAVQRPRDLKEVLKKAKAEAELAGEGFYYRWSTKNKDGSKGLIEGPSFNMAMSLFRNFGNCVLTQRPAKELMSAWLYCSAVVDLENGTTYERELIFDKREVVFGNMDEFRKDRNRFQKGESLCQRNAILAFMPDGLVDQVLETAKDSARGKIEARIKRAGGDVNKVIDEIFAAFKKLGITPEQVENQIGRKRTAFDINDLSALVADLKAIDRGEESADSLYGKAPSPAAETDKGTLQEKVAKAAANATGKAPVAPDTHNAPTDASPASDPGPSPAAGSVPSPSESAPEDPEKARHDELADQLHELAKTNQKFLSPRDREKYGLENCMAMSIDQLQEGIDHVNSLTKKSAPAGKGRSW